MVVVTFTFCATFHIICYFVLPPSGHHSLLSSWIFKPVCCLSSVDECDFLNLTFLRSALPERNAVMRYSNGTCNRLMVHLAELINRYVEVEEASGSVKEVVSTLQRLQITFWSVDHFTAFITSCLTLLLCWYHVEFEHRSNMIKTHFRKTLSEYSWKNNFSNL